jgi:16S rRNA A1518/A1519 N6-dimethyltransferase RsmA/KsgA/DIM1 with predicted DNA glycosylase/AP lyase activity
MNLVAILNLIILFFSLLAIVLIWLIYSRSKGAEYAFTTDKKARKMIELAQIKKTDIVYDLGSGLGGLVFKSAKYSKKSIGIEYDFLRYLISKIRSPFFRQKNVHFLRADLFQQDISDANVIFLFLKQKTNQKLKNKLQRLKKGTRVVSNIWTFEDWKPVKSDKKTNVYLYIIGKSNI